MVGALGLWGFGAVEGKRRGAKRGERTTSRGSGGAGRSDDMKVNQIDSIKFHHHHHCCFAFPSFLRARYHLFGRELFRLVAL